MGDESGRGGLAVRASDGNDARSFEKVERDFNLTRDRNAFLARERERPRFRWHARACNDECRSRESLQIVPPEFYHDSLYTQLLRAPSSVGRRCYIRCVNVVTVLSQQHRRGTTTPGEADD